jgi:uncharacterized membrane protein YfcA
MKQEQTKPMDVTTIITLMIIGIFAGFASGMVGIGGGVVIVPALVFFLAMSQHQAQGVSIGMMLMPVGFLAAYNYYKSGNFNFKYSVIIGLTFVVGAYFGSKVSLTIDQVLMKRIFGVIMLILAIKMIMTK